MLFNSYVFIFAFLPICLIGYYGLNHLQKYKAAEWFLLAMSLWFYAYFNPKYITIILASILMNYVVYRMMVKFELRDGKNRMRLVIFIAGLAFDIGLLLYFKYMDFFIDTINRIFGTEHELLGILLPLGISFFTFQQISFITDAYKGEVPNYSFLEYACFVTFFPQLIAGPIVTHDELIPQFRDKEKKRLNWENTSRGIYIFAFGLSKKVLLADTFGNAANAGYADIASLDATNAILTMLCYTIQIYFDFSGYCDMAIGLGKMMNFDLPLNFNSPYKALTITEFWDRWHMTLTRFFTKYVYIPLGGSRHGEARTYINIFLVFLLSGFWHGAGFTFIIWGICHGLFSIITRRFKKFFDRLHPALNWMIMFGFVNVTWVFFRANTIHDALRLLNRIAIMQFGPIKKEIVACFQLSEITTVAKHIPRIGAYPHYMMIAFFAIAFCLILGSENAYEKMQKFRPTVRNMVLSLFLFVWCVCSFTGISTFLYFNF